MTNRVYTAHQHPRDEDVRTVLIDDRWRWGAFLFPQLWALWSRHWLAALWLFAASAGLAALAARGFEGPALALEIGLRFAVGFEGGALARLDRRLRGWEEVGAVAADDAEEAELRWFGRPA
jgi:signal transduction histidine kinase